PRGADAERPPAPVAHGHELRVEQEAQAGVDGGQVGDGDPAAARALGGHGAARRAGAGAGPSAASSSATGVVSTATSSPLGILACGPAGGRAGAGREPSRGGGTKSVAGLSATYAQQGRARPSSRSSRSKAAGCGL